MQSRIRPANSHDVPAILNLIKALAEFEKLSHEVVATEDLLRSHLFGARPSAEVLICETTLEPKASALHSSEITWEVAGFALFFTSFSTFLGVPGIYLEDLFIKPEARSFGLGKKMLAELAKLTLHRGYGRLEWSVLDWNVRARKFYEELGAKPMEEWTVHRVAGEALHELAK